MSKLSYANIIRTAMTAISNDDALQSWCIENYGIAPVVVNDLDPMQPLTEADCPFVGFTPVGGANGQDQMPFQRGIIVRCAISDDEIEERFDASGRRIWMVYKGTDRISHLLENLIYPALCRAFNQQNIPVSTEDEEIGAIDLTLFQAMAGLSFQFDKVIGEDRPLLG